MDMDFKGKTAIVTGGTRGIGREMVIQLAARGCNVIFTGTTESSGKKIKNTRFHPLDLSDEASLRRFEHEIIAPLRSVNILINNAGINVIEPCDEITDETWDAIITVNLSGPMRMTRMVAKKMKSNKSGGKILNISSIFAVVSKEKRNAYSASKTGLIGLTRSSALDLAPDNILVNAICPGFTMTELTKSVLSKKDMDMLKKEVPLQRFAEVDEIARAALFLCSGENTYITGQTLVVDGGFTIR
jgi:3-oxoacyl-[acyl-carrier protein] reductase